jgi:hypothetical protein
MPRPKKKQRRLEEVQSNDVVASAANDPVMPSFDDLGTDELAHIFGFLPREDILRARLNKKMREAAKKTIVPLTDFVVISGETYNAMATMSTALPNSPQITLCYLDHGHKFSDGEDPVDYRAELTANWTTYDIISNFTRLRILTIEDAPLNGRYPFLFNFPLLQSLNVSDCSYLKWDLEMLAGLPLLKELNCDINRGLTGNINSLRLLKDTLTTVVISNCFEVEGNFIDLAHFPHLNHLDLSFTAVKGDIREIRQSDFSALEYLDLPSGVYGGSGYQFQRISDGPDVMSTLYCILKQRPTLRLNDWYGMYAELSGDSPDWYDRMVLDDDRLPPFHIRIVQAGSRVGYRWQSPWISEDETSHYEGCVACEVNWFDPEPFKESSDYAKYIEELQKVERQVDFYRGFHQPPTEEEYNRLWDRT